LIPRLNPPRDFVAAHEQEWWLPVARIADIAGLGPHVVERHAAPTMEEEQQTPKPKRVRPPRVEIASEPLEIIETRKETPPTAP